jgi:hypothetical protein
MVSPRSNFVVWPSRSEPKAGHSTSLPSRNDCAAVDRSRALPPKGKAAAESRQSGSRARARRSALPGHTGTSAQRVRNGTRQPLGDDKKRRSSTPSVLFRSRAGYRLRPIRTVQRNGRLRQVNGWAAVTGQKIRYAYPAFGGTRDHRLVQIMKRINSFSLLLGSVQDFEVDELPAPEEEWRNDVIDAAKIRLRKAGRQLATRGF